MTSFENEPLIVYPFAGLLGLVIGSFLNVVIHRLPLMLFEHWRKEEENEEFRVPPRQLDLAFPASHCPQCQQPIRLVNNIPLFSYIKLRGKCADCGAPISLRYPIVEALTALITLIITYQFGITWQCLAALFFSWSLIALCFIDFEHQLLPDAITLPLLWLGLIISTANLFVDSTQAIIGAAIGYGLLWSVYTLFKAFTGKEGMGFGDFKLLAAIGAWVGWTQLPFVILFSSIVGLVVGVTQIKRKKLERQQAIPFGPYLALAGLVSLLWGEKIMSYYLSNG